MKKWCDLEKWAKEIANVNIVKILKESGYTAEQIKQELECKKETKDSVRRN